MKKILHILILFTFYQIPGVNAQEEVKTVVLDTVEIRADAIDDIRYIPISYIDKEDLHTTNTHDIGDFLRSIPNISGIRKGGSAIDPVVRGYKYSQLNIVLNNGVKIENGCPNRMDPATAHIEPEDIENIEVIKGPFSLRYGPSFGGVINLVSDYPKPYEKFEIHADALYGYESNWNGNKGHLSLHGGNGNIYFLLGGGYKKYGDYRSGRREGADITYNSSFKKYNYLAKIGFSLTPNQNIQLSYDRSYGRDVMYPALPMDEISDDTQIISVDYKARNLSYWLKSVDIKAYQSDVHHVMDNRFRPNYDTMQMIADVYAINTGGRAHLTMRFSKHRILAGVDYENISKDGKRTAIMEMTGMTTTDITTTKVKNLWNDALIRNAGLFFEYKTFFSSYEFDASIRSDYNCATSGDTLLLVKDGIDYFNDVNSLFFNVSASAGITKRINKSLQISLALGRGTRSPNMLERYIKLLPAGYDNYDYLGNPQLKPETNNEIDLTFLYNNENTGSANFNLFYSYVTDFITAEMIPLSVITPQSQGVLGVKQFYNTDYITSKGFEFGYKSPDKFKLGGNIVAAYTHAVIPSVKKYIIENNQVVDDVMVKNDALPEIPPFETTMNVYYKFLQGNLVPKFTLRVVADQHHTSDAFYEPYTPGFGLLHFSMYYKINRYANINTGVMNIFDRTYYEHLNRKIIGSKANFYEPGRLFFVNLYITI